MIHFDLFIETGKRSWIKLAYTEERYAEEDIMENVEENELISLYYIDKWLTLAFLRRQCSQLESIYSFYDLKKFWTGEKKF